MHPLFWPRCRAYGRDAVGYLGLAAATLPLGIPLNLAGVRQHRGAVIALSAVPPLAAALMAARAESDDRHDTWGKRAEGLTVRRLGGGRPSYRRALARNIVKITVPWQVGHVVAIGAAYGGFEAGDPVTIGAGISTYVIIGAFAVTGGFGGGRGVHDRLTATVVERA